jgi:hypothetical protein
MNVFYRSTAFTIISVCFQEEGCGDTKDGGEGRPEWIPDRLDKYLLPPCREPDLMMRDQKMMKRRRRRRTNDLGEGEGFDDESREATLRHPSLGESRQSGGEGAKVAYLTTCVAILIATKLVEITQQTANQRPENRNYCEAMQLFSDMAMYLAK